MQPVDQFELEGTRHAIINHAAGRSFPALVFPDGKILTEWAFSDEERAAVARGENLRVWIWGDGQHRVQPFALALTDERIA